MRRRRTVVAVGALVALAGLTGAVALLLSDPGRPGVSLTTLARVEPGMSEAEVETVLGPQTADRTDRPPPRVSPPAAGGRLLEYAGERATAVVECDPSGRTDLIAQVQTEVRYTDKPSPPPTCPSSASCTTRPPTGGRGRS